MRRVLVLAVGFAVFAHQLVAQNPEWLLATNTGPLSRTGHAMAEAGNGRVLLFSGSWDCFSCTPSPDTWLWDGAAWQLHASAVAPSRRDGHAMAYDAARDCVVLFGGSDAQGYCNDTWEWTAAGWSLRSTVGPVPRGGHAMAYDAAHQRTVLFGGVTTGLGNLADTWEWNGVAWTPRVTAVYPAARQRHGMAYDPLRGRTVLMGGFGNGGGPIWEWNGAQWLAMAAGDPLASRSSWLAFDPLHGRVLGTDGVSTLWWNGAAVTAPAPSPGGGTVTGDFGPMAADSQRQRVVRFGRQVLGNAVFVGATLEFSYALRPASATLYGAGCGAPPLAFAAAAGSLPRIGGVFTTEVANVPSGLPFVAFGANDQMLGPFPLPLALDGFGYVGCLLHHDAFLSLPCTQTTSPSTAVYDLSIPNVPALLTSRLLLQAWSLAPGVNPGGAVLSNAMRIVIGNS